jgi:hypothetical protein
MSSVVCVLCASTDRKRIPQDIRGESRQIETVPEYLFRGQGQEQPDGLDTFPI